MENEIRISVNSLDFKVFIDSISSISRENIVFNVHDNLIEAQVNASDNTIGMVSQIKILNELNGVNEIVSIKDITKFQKLLNLNNAETFSFKIVNNVVYYESPDRIKAKFVLLENSYGGQMKKGIIKALNESKSVCVFYLSKENVRNILQQSSFSDNTDKIYFYISEGDLMCEFSDKQISLSDSLTIKVCDNYSGYFSGEVVYNLSTFTKLYLSKNNIKFDVCQKSMGAKNIVFFIATIETENVVIKYLLSPLLK